MMLHYTTLVYATIQYVQHITLHYITWHDTTYIPSMTVTMNITITITHIPHTRYMHFTHGIRYIIYIYMYLEKYTFNLQINM